MARNKLRNCSKCNVRHGPPIGTRCKRTEDEFLRLNVEMDETRKSESRDDVGKVKDGASEAKSTVEPGVTSPGEDEKNDEALGQEPVADQDFLSFSEY